MNPYIYSTFKSDMLEASKNFIYETDYYVKKMTFSYFILTNDRKDICFELDGANMITSLNDLIHRQNIGIYELFMKENIMYKYPVDTEMNKERAEWYKYLVKELLNILMKDLKKYIV